MRVVAGMPASVNADLLAVTKHTCTSTYFLTVGVVAGMPVLLAVTKHTPVSSYVLPVIMGTSEPNSSTPILH